DRGQGDDAGPHPRDRRARGPEEGPERDRAQAPGEPPAGGQGGHRGRPREEDRHPLPAGQRGRRPEARPGHGPEWRHRDAAGDPHRADAADVAPVPARPEGTPAVPAGFDWDLWLGPSRDRPYHPHYTHTNFRGWYEFGGGSLADMGHYSLWPLFQLL